MDGEQFPLETNDESKPTTTQVRCGPFLKWSEEEVAKLTALLNEKKSIPEIARILGRTERGTKDAALYRNLKSQWSPPIKWTEEKVDQLRDLRKIGYSYQLIADKLGETKSACIAAAHRHGFPTFARATITNSPPQRPKKPRVRKPDTRVRVRRRKYVPPVDALPPMWRGLQFMKLTNRSCRYPSENSPFTYCGDPTANITQGRPYCDYHARLCCYYAV